MERKTLHSLRRAAGNYTLLLKLACLFFSLFTSSGVYAQQLELWSGSASTAATGPVTSTSATFYQNTGTNTTFSSYTPATTVSVAFSNQQYTSSTYPGLTFGGFTNFTTTTLAAVNIFVPVNNVSPNSASLYTSAPNTSTSGTNFSTSGAAPNYTFRAYTDPYYLLGQSLSGRFYYGDMTITFSRPVINPVLHFTDLGGAISNGIAVQGFWPEFELSTNDVTAGRTLTRLSGSTHFVLDGTATKILNNSVYTGLTTANYADPTQEGGFGSVFVNTAGTAVASITFRVYLRGSGGSSGSAVWGVSGLGRAGDTWLLSASLGLYNVSGNVFEDVNGLTDNTVNGTGTNGGGLFANLVDANGNVYASTAVAAGGTYSFNNVVTSTYTVILTSTAQAVGNTLSAASLNTKYQSAGENLGSGAGSDGTVDSKLAIVVSNADVTNANFGLTYTPTAFTCANLAYQVIYDGSSQSILRSYNMVTGNTVDIGTGYGVHLQGIGYNLVDNLIWGYAVGGTAPNKTIARLEADGNTATKYTIPNFNPTNITSGTVLPGGYLMLHTYLPNSTEKLRYWVVDINPARPSTYLQLVDPTNGYALASLPYYTVANEPSYLNFDLIADWAYNPANGLLYSIQFYSTPTARVVSLNPVTRAVAYSTDFTIPNGNSGGVFGAVFIDAAGKMYAFSNANGSMYRINNFTAATGGSATLLNTPGPANISGSTDGASCSNAFLTTLTIGGTIFNDANGVTDNAVNGAGTNAGGLNAILYDNTTSQVVGVVAVAANGTYSFSPNQGDNYTVYVTTGTATVGQSSVPTITLPAGWVSTGENNCVNTSGCTGSDGTPNSILSLGVVSTNISQANFGIERTPTANNVSGTFTNPGGTATVTVPTLNGTDPEQGAYPGTGNLDTVIINTLPASGTLYYNGVAVTLNQQINNYDPTKLTYDPPAGGGTFTFTYSEVDAALKSSTPATVSMTFNTISVSGNVFDDVNGLTDNTVNGTGTNGGGLNAVLIDNATGKVAATATVAANGTYSFAGIDGGNYSVEITTNTATVGNTPPAVALPSGYSSTGENLGAAAGNDGTANGILSLGSIGANTTNANFGIEQIPTANNASGTFTNPGGTATVQVPTLNGSDPEQGTYPGTGNVDTVIINTLPASGTLYYNGVAVTAGQQINNYDPTKLTYDPPAGGGTYTFTYSEVDAALKSSTPATVSMTFNTISVSGNVYDDANGLTDNTVNGTGTNGGGLNAVLIDNATGKVAATATVAANGTYSFAGIDGGNYSVEITTNTATVGSTPPAVAFPSGYSSTGENLGAAAGNDGTANGILSLGSIGANTTNANFGIEQIPTANNASGTFTNPGGTATVQVPTLNGTDPEQGTYPGTGNVDTVIINTLPASGTLYYNGVAVTPGQQINNYDPTKLTYDPPSGGGTYTFTYSEVDAALKSSTPATVSMTFNDLTISGTAYDDADGGTIDGIATNTIGSNTLYANLVNGSGNVIASVPVAANGTYSFGTADGVVQHTNYTVVVTNGAQTIGSAPNTTLSNAANTAEGTTAAGDGNANGSTAVSVGTTSVTNVNFGIDQKPNSDNKTTNISTPASNSYLTLDGTGSNPPFFTGNDAEDQVTSGTLQHKSVQITSLPTNGTLLYNGLPVNAGDVLNGFDPSLLQIQFTGTGYMSLSFNYAFVDAANIADPTPAAYVLTWAKPLPVVLKSFMAVKGEGCSAVLNWETGTETNCAGFTAERSTDNGQTFEATGSTAAKGNGSSYMLIDKAPQEGRSLYRLRITDKDGSYVYSNISAVTLSCTGITKIVLWPNPAEDYVMISGLTTGMKLKIYDINGRLLINMPASGVTQRIALDGYTPGTYQVLIMNEKGETIDAQKILKQ
ncbi:T9SS type A sorting domain-containing protein [Chitinophagaceae bacterium MMS25-I14]